MIAILAQSAHVPVRLVFLFYFFTTAMLAKLLVLLPFSAAAPLLVRAPSASTVGRSTPFGLVHESCIIELESGALIEELSAGSSLGPAGHVRVRHATGKEEIVPPCSEEPRAVAARSPAPHLKPDASPPFWNGWPQHTWLGTSWAHFTDPPLPANETIWSINASWAVPPAPQNTHANSSDPWQHEAPTLSWWVGLQGPTVLQPVLEWNGLIPQAYDAVSWNCCPGSMAWHSKPIEVKPGETLDGEIVRVSGAEVNASDSMYTFLTRTAVRDGSETLLYSAMSAGEAGWAPTWAEVVQESYFVTSCDRLPCTGGEFASVRVSTAANGAWFNESTPVDVPLVPWSRSYEVEGSGTPGTPVCGAEVTFGQAATAAVSEGAAAVSDGAGVNITYDCEAEH